MSADAAPATPAVEVLGLEHGFSGGSFRLCVDAFRVEEGERVALLGKSGSGKTTLLSLIAGLFPPRRGSIRVHGEEVSAMAEPAARRLRATTIGFVFQDFELLEYLDARENVLLPYALHPALGPVEARVEARLADLARRAGIDALLARKPRALSQGERQRVALCRALIARPRLLLADEPTGNLDATTAGTIVHLLLDEAREAGAAVVCVTHDLALASRFDRVVAIEELSPSSSHPTGGRP